VKFSTSMNPPVLYVEIGQNLVKALRENEGMELPLERQPDGRLTTACKDKVVAALKQFVKAKSWQPRARAMCAIGSRGVLLRRLSLPAGTKEEFYRRLLLQIESEFPLSPDELAWGCQPLGEPQSSNPVMAKQELLVAAVKIEVVADYHEILWACGTEPFFTLAALARRELYAGPADSFAMLDIGNDQSELTIFEKGVPTASRIIFWGGENSAGSGDGQLEVLAKTIKANLTGTKLFVSGNKISDEFITQLTKVLSNGVQCERLEVTGIEGRPAAISGLKKITGQGGEPALRLRVKQTGGAAISLTSLDLKKWGMRAGALAVALLLLPFAEALLLKPHLAKKVAAFKIDAERLKVIDRELDFLRYLKSSQPPYLDALYIFSKSVPPGTRFDSLSLNSHGAISLRAAFRDGQQVADFLTKLIDSGFFTNVTVEEQVPTPDRQKVNVRISAQEKPAAQLVSLSVGPAPDEMSTNGKTALSNAMSSGGLSVPTNSLPALRKEAK
jgi:hypothetical protein